MSGRELARSVLNVLNDGYESHYTWASENSHEYQTLIAKTEVVIDGKKPKTRLAVSAGSAPLGIFFNYEVLKVYGRKMVS
jgi:hypothetical protein